MLLIGKGLFQFHTGSIKRWLNGMLLIGKGLFQFHTGSIKRPPPDALERNETAFQFHTGSIKSPNNQQKILYKTRAISTREKLLLGLKVVNVRLCGINGGLTTARG